MSPRTVSGLSSRLLTQLELTNLARIGEVYRPGFQTQAAGGRMDDLLRGMSFSDYWMFRALLITKTLLPLAVFRWIARCEDEATGAMHYRIAAGLHFPLKTLVVVLFYGDSVERQIAESRNATWKRARHPD